MAVKGPVGSIVSVVRSHRGWFGLGTGLAIGIVVAALVGTHVMPILRGTGAAEPGTLVIMSGSDESFGEQRRALVEQWNDAHPHNPAVIKKLSTESDAQHATMVRQAQSGQNDVDIYNLDVTWTPEFASSGYIRPLNTSSLDTSGFFKAPLRTVQYDGKLWGLPFNSDAGLLYYRDKVVRTPPTKWLGVPKFTGQANSEDMAMYALQLADYEGLTVNALEAIWSTGGDVVDRDSREVVIDSKEAREGLRRLAMALKSSDPQVVMRESLGFDEGKTTDAFRSGKVLMMRNWPVVYSKLSGAPSDDKKSGKSSFRVTNLPGPTVLGGQNLAIASGSKKPRAAQQLIEFLTSERSQQILFERGGFAATRKSVYNDRVIRDKYPYSDTLRKAIETARPRPDTVQYNRFSQEFRSIVLETIQRSGELPDSAVSRLTEALKGYLPSPRQS